MVINVSANGRGIKTEGLEKIFDPFYTTKEVDKGTGPGFFTVYTIVRKHGGLITVYSEPGSGTEFKIHLHPSIDSRQEHYGTEAEDNRVPRGDNEFIMVVDDEPVVRDATK